MEQQDSKNTTEETTPKKPARWTEWLLYAGIAALFVAGLAMILRQEVLPSNPDFVAPTPPPATTQAAVETPVATPPAGDSPVASPEATPIPTPRMEMPTVIYFERHKQQANIIAVGITEGREMGSPDNAQEAGWFYYGSAPGNPGNAVVNGHRSFKGESGIFSILKKLKQGDTVAIEFESGMLRFFAVDRVEEYKAEEVPKDYLATGPDTPTQLTLITCLGDFGLDGFSKSRVVAICHELTELRQADDPVVDSYEGITG